MSFSGKLVGPWLAPLPVSLGVPEVSSLGPSSSRRQLATKIELLKISNFQLGNEILTETVPCLVYLVEATYEYFTVYTTAFIKFLAAWMRDVAESN